MPLFHFFAIYYLKYLGQFASFLCTSVFSSAKCGYNRIYLTELL